MDTDNLTAFAPQATRISAMVGSVCPVFEKAKPADPNEWVNWKEQDYFFDDGNSPWQRRRRKVAADTLARCNRVLAEWGFPALPKPSPPFGGDLTHQPRVNPYAEPSPVSDTLRLRRSKAIG
jgi:hypothetical protein